MAKRTAIHKERRAPEQPEPAPAQPSWLQRYSLVVFLVLTAIGSARIVSTYRVFNHTFDEPAHIACGMEWLSRGVYRYEPQHPPLARVAAALGPSLAGLRSHGVPGMWEEGLAILYSGGEYDRNLALARLGVLPFFWVAVLVVYVWARRCSGEPGAAFAVLCFTLLPPILAHAGLATTDMALTAMTGASFLTALLWLERPSLPRSLLFGAATALAVLSKFSALAFLPAAMGAALIWHVLTRRGPWRWALGQYLPGFCVAASTGALIIWAAYRFSFGAVSFTSLRLPAPELYAGIQQVIDHNRHGDPAYLLGGHSQSGWWYFYLVALAVKTPLPFLGLLVYGIAVRKRGAAWLALLFSLGILVAASFSHINLGIRHALPVYIGSSIVAGAGAARLFERARKAPLAGWVLSGLVLWLAAASAFSHPDYLAYFNVLAGAEPERILVDSDLDWGQDMKRLARRLHEAGTTAVSFTPFNHADLAAQGFPPAQPNDPLRPAPGWNAVSLTFLKNARMGLGAGRPEVKLWPEQIKPTERVGKGIWLWYFPPEAAPPR